MIQTVYRLKIFQQYYTLPPPQLTFTSTEPKLRKPYQLLLPTLQSSRQTPILENIFTNLKYKTKFFAEP